MRSVHAGREPVPSERLNSDMVTRFAMLDQERGALRLLVTLEKHGQGLARQQLINELREQGVGRSSLYSSLDACRKLGLVADVKMQRDSKFLTVSMLSERGYRLARKLLDVKKMLDEVILHVV